MEDPYQYILDNLNTAVLLFDRDLRLRYLNPAAEMLFAMSKRHLVGQAAAEILVASDRELSADLSLSAETGHPFTERELCLTLPGRREITVDCTVMPLVEPQGESEVLVELLQLDRQLRISREEHLISQLHTMRELIRSLAHEIKNPLGGLRGAAQLLEHELAGPELKEYTQVIIDEADRLQSLVNRMLGPNKIPTYAEVNIHQVLDRVRYLVQAESGERLKLECDFDPSIPDLIGDSDQLIQAILNIVRNAACAVGEGGRIVLRTRIQRQFTIGNERYKLVAQVDIEDNGPGIEPDMLQRIFYPMVTASEGGLGLGLSIAQSLINQHGGLVECRSKPGETVFTVLLPVENPHA